MARYRIAIIGYGVAGIAAAIALRREGHEITHFEARASAPSGGGLLIQPLGLKVLKELGVLEAILPQGERVFRSQAFESDGSTMLALAYDSERTSRFALGIRRNELLRVLTEQDSGAHRVIRDQRIIGVDQTGGRLRAQSGLEFGGFDLVLAADGWNSAVRTQLAHAFGVKIRHASESALVCVLSLPAEVVGANVVQKFRGYQHVSYWPVGPGHVAVAMNLPAHVKAELSQESFLAQSESIYPLVRNWFSQQSEPVEILHFRYADIRIQTCVHRHVVLLGDAAHAMSPMLGLGASLAIEDAISLATILRGNGDLTNLLRNYAKQRCKRMAPIQRLSRVASALMNAQSLPLRAVRKITFRQLQRFPSISGWFMDRLA